MNKQLKCWKLLAKLMDKQWKQLARSNISGQIGEMLKKYSLNVWL